MKEALRILKYRIQSEPKLAFVILGAELLVGIVGGVIGALITLAVVL